MDHEEKLDIKGSSLYGRDLVWCAPVGAMKPVLTIRRVPVSDLTAQVHPTPGHPGVFSTLTLLRERFHWPTMAREVREYVLSFGYRRRKRFAS